MNFPIYTVRELEAIARRCPSMQRAFIALIALSLGLSACNRGAEETTTTTTTVADQSVTSTTGQQSSTDSTIDDTDASDTADGEVDEPTSELPGYTIVRREGAEGGDRLVVLLEEFEYTDRVLEELVFEITEVYAPVLEAYFIDDVAAADLLLVDPAGLSESDQAVLEEHLFVSLTSGNLVTFEGPFADIGEFRLGS